MCDKKTVWYELELLDTKQMNNYLDLESKISELEKKLKLNKEVLREFGKGIIKVCEELNLEYDPLINNFIFALDKLDQKDGEKLDSAHESSRKTNLQLGMEANKSPVSHTGESDSKPSKFRLTPEEYRPKPSKPIPKELMDSIMSHDLKPIGKEPTEDYNINKIREYVKTKGYFLVPMVDLEQDINSILYCHSLSCVKIKGNKMKEKYLGKEDVNE